MLPLRALLLSESLATQDGAALGREAAERILAMRRDDGADRKVQYTPGASQAAWKPTPPAFQPAALPQWPQVKPFVIPSVDKFPMPGPHAVDSADYARDVEDFRAGGGRDLLDRAHCHSVERRGAHPAGRQEGKTPRTRARRNSGARSVPSWWRMRLVR